MEKMGSFSNAALATSSPQLRAHACTPAAVASATKVASASKVASATRDSLEPAQRPFLPRGPRVPCSRRFQAAGYCWRTNWHYASPHCIPLPMHCQQQTLQGCRCTAGTPAGTTPLWRSPRHARRLQHGCPAGLPLPTGTEAAGQEVRCEHLHAHVGGEVGAPAWDLSWSSTAFWYRGGWAGGEVRARVPLCWWGGGKCSMNLLVGRRQSRELLTLDNSSLQS